jgi:hypothetical protein
MEKTSGEQMTKSFILAFVLIFSICSRFKTPVEPGELWKNSVPYLAGAGYLILMVKGDVWKIQKSIMAWIS